MQGPIPNGDGQPAAVIDLAARRPPVACIGRRGYGFEMADRVNLADPTYEPSDEDLKRLMHEAFAGLREAREQSLVEMRTRIAALQLEARARFTARWSTTRST